MADEQNLPQAGAAVGGDVVAGVPFQEAAAGAAAVAPSWVFDLGIPEIQIEDQVRQALKCFNSADLERRSISRMVVLRYGELKHLRAARLATCLCDDDPSVRFFALNALEMHGIAPDVYQAQLVQGYRQSLDALKKCESLVQPVESLKAMLSDMQEGVAMLYDDAVDRDDLASIKHELVARVSFMADIVFAMKESMSPRAFAMVTSELLQSLREGNVQIDAFLMAHQKERFAELLHQPGSNAASADPDEVGAASDCDEPEGADGPPSMGRC